jgi:hypothetical protein
MSVEEMARMLPVAEKIRLMEVLWAEFSIGEVDYRSPQWHRSVLEETEARFAVGEEQAIDWSEAKQRLRESR